MLSRERKWRVYYPGFWYTRGIFERTDSLAPTAVRARVSQVLDELRLLSLIYDEIYVPRSHFLTSFHDAHRDFISNVVQSSEFKWLRDSAILVSSASPEIDSKLDTDRIFERTCHLGWLRPLATKKDRLIISQISPIKVDSKTEAANSLIDYRKMAVTLERARNAKGLSDLINASSYKDIEFFHELFLKQLRESSFQTNVKEELWRATNEIYLSNVGTELGRVIVPYADVEPRLPRDIDGDVRLYNADTLRIVMNTVIGSKKYLAWIAQPADRALDFRMDSTSKEWFNWKIFQASYFVLLLDFDEILLSIRKSQGIEVPDIRMAIVSEMTRISGGDAISAFFQAANGFTRIASPYAGVATNVGTSGLSRLLSQLVKYCILGTRYKPIASFLRNTVSTRGKK